MLDRYQIDFKLMMFICNVFLAILICLVILYTLLECNYFLRLCLCVLLTKIRRKKNILDETSIKGICLTTDIDSLLTHMNNARFIRELDFAKVDFYERTGMYKSIRKRGGNLAMGATTIRYRRYIKLFAKYTITSKIIYWDHQNVYMEHRFVTQADNFINAIILCRIRLTNCNAEEVIAELLAETGCLDVENNKGPSKPVMSPCLAKWIESNEISSCYLRNSA